MARIVIAGLTGHAIAPEGDGNTNVPIFLSVDSETGQVSGHATFDLAAGVDQEDKAETSEGGDR